MKPVASNGIEDERLMFYCSIRFSELSECIDPSAYTVTLGFHNNASVCCALQLILKSKATSPITLYFLMLRGPFGEMQVQPKIYHFEFSESNCESPLVAFPLTDSAECNKVLSGKAINCRFVLNVAALCGTEGHPDLVMSLSLFFLSTGWSCSCVPSEAGVVPHVFWRAISWPNLKNGRVFMCSS